MVLSLPSQGCHPHVSFLCAALGSPDPTRPALPCPPPPQGAYESRWAVAREGIQLDDPLSPAYALRWLALAVRLHDEEVEGELKQLLQVREQEAGLMHCQR